MTQNTNKTNLSKEQLFMKNSIKNFNEVNNIMTKELTNQAKKQKDIYYTKVFLEAYREIIWTMKFYANSNAPITDNQSLRALIQSCPEIKSLLSIFNIALKQIKCKPKDGIIMHDIIYFSYMDKKDLSVSEMIYYEIGIGASTYYRKKKVAIKLISERIWNSGHPNTNAWIKFVEALDDKQHRKEAS